MKSPGSDFKAPTENQAPPGDFHPTPGGAAPPWQSILPQGGGPAQLSDPFRAEPNGPPAPPPVPAGTPPAAGAAPREAGGTDDPAAVARLPPDLRREYAAAKASGNDALASRILLAGTMAGNPQPFEGRGNRSDWGGSMAGAPSGGGQVSGASRGAIGKGAGGLY